MSTFAKPENALQRAQELIAVGQKDEALKSLRTVITSRRFRVWQKTLETLMLKYIQLCVELRKGKEAKDGLHQYKSICQQANVGSLGVVIKYFLEQSDNNAKEAQSKAEKITLDLVEDLEAEETPESFMLGRVSGEDTKDRTDREIVTPWLKFLWETYRTVLDILKNNAKLEQLYQQTAQQAFAFCRKYKRNTEFRRLSELLRTHLSNIGKSYNLQNAISLANAESLQLHLETRFAQLNAACDLELWQEAFRSVEDLHGLMMMAKKPPKVYMLANYYERLTKIFWVSGNAVLHAYAWYKFYGLSKLQNKGLTPEELKMMGSSVLLSALCIPIEPQRAGDGLLELDDIQKEKNQRLASLLGPTPIPPRDQFLTELIGRNVLGPVLGELSDLFALLEQRFSPLDYCQALRAKLEFMATQPALKQYVAPLQKNIFIRLLQQLSRVYQRLKLSELAQLAYFVDSRELEKSIVEVVHAGYVDARIDYLNSAINFGSETQESDLLRAQLTQLSRSLQTVVHDINPDRQAEKEAARQQLFQTILVNVRREHEKVTERKHIIEKRKEIKEQISRVKAAAADAAKTAAKKKDNSQLIAERKRQEREEQEKELRRKREEEAKLKEEEDRKAALRKSKLESERKTASVAVRLDHLERARREEERPLLESYYSQLQEGDRKYYESQMAAFRENQAKAHAKELEEKKRLGRMQPFRAAFEASIMKRREEEYKVAKAAQDKRLEGARAEVAREREKRRLELEERKRREAEKQKEEERKREERRKMEEELRKEEQEREEREERLRKEEEEEDARIRAEEEAAEAESRRKAAERRGQEPAASGGGRPDVWRRPGDRGRDERDRSPERSRPGSVRSERDERSSWDRRGPERSDRDQDRDDDRWSRRGPGDRPSGPPTRAYGGDRDRDRDADRYGRGDRDRDRDRDDDRDRDRGWARGPARPGPGGPRPGDREREGDGRREREDDRDRDLDRPGDRDRESDRPLWGRGPGDRPRPGARPGDRDRDRDLDRSGDRDRDRDRDDDRWGRRGPSDRPSGPPPRAGGDRDRDRERDRDLDRPGDRERDREREREPAREREGDSRWSRGSSGGGPAPQGAWSRGGPRDGGREGGGRPEPSAPAAAPRGEGSREGEGGGGGRPAPRSAPEGRSEGRPAARETREAAPPPSAAASNKAAGEGKEGGEGGGASEEDPDGWSTVARPARRGKRGN